MNIRFDDVSSFFSRVASGDIFRKQDTFAEYLAESGRYNTEADVLNNFDHLVEDVRNWTHAKGYKQAEALMDFMIDKKQGKTRKDEVTPGALHEITQAVWFISCIEDGLPVDDPEGVLSIIFSHDLGEDFGTTPDELRGYLSSKRAFSKQGRAQEFLDDFDVISKRYGKNGEPKHRNDYEYYLAIQTSKNASVAKMFDRAHNIMTLIGLKENESSADKIRMTEYLAKTLQLQSDYVRDASAAFPSQAETYKALEFVIEQEAQVCRYYIVDTGKKITDDEDLRSEMPEKGFRKLPNGFHPLIFAAERIRHTYPETHLGTRAESKTNLDYAQQSGTKGKQGNGDGGAAGSQDAAGDIPEVTQ